MNHTKTIAISILEFFFILLIAWNFEFLGAIEKTAIVLLSLVITGTTIQRINNLEGGYGIVIVKLREKLQFLDSFANKNEKLLNFLADLMIFFGYGLLAYVFFERNQKRQKESIPTERNPEKIRQEDDQNHEQA